MTKLDMERIATLASHPGYHALLKLIDEADVSLLDRLETADPQLTTDILPLWKASRRIRRLLANRPEALAEELGNFLGDDLT